MFQQAFGFVRLAPILEGFAPKPGGSVPPSGPFVPGSKRPFLNSARVGTIRELLVRLHTASHTPPQASSTKNLRPSRSIGCASRFAHPCSDAAPAEPQKKSQRRYIPLT